MLPSSGVQLLKENKQNSPPVPLSVVGIAVATQVASVGVVPVVTVGIGSCYVSHNGVVGDLVRHEGAVVGVRS